MNDPRSFMGFSCALLCDCEQDNGGVAVVADSININSRAALLPPLNATSSL